MKAKQLLKLYANGKRDFQGKNLRGLSFKNQDLSGADFSYCDIRGTDFSGANLTGVKFIDAKAGLLKRWEFILLLAFLALTFIAGYFAIFVGQITFYIDHKQDLTEQIANWVILFFILVFIWLSFYQRAITGIAVLARVVVLAFIIAGVVTATGTEALALAVAFLGVLAVAFVGAITRYVVLAVAGAGRITIFNFHLDELSTKGNPTEDWIWEMALNFASIGATTFNKTNLTDADFTGAILKNANFQKAKLIRTCFKDTKKLDLACPGNTYLKNLQIQKLLQSGQGAGINLDQQDLQGINLYGANLIGGSLIGTNLSFANLQGTNLSKCKLVQAELDETDFTGATLTGAYIQDWGITSRTKFDHVICKYVYMNLPTEDNLDPMRKPDNRQEEFADGEFGDFIKPIVDTLDLYHTENIDPRAISIALKNLAENNPEAGLKIKAMENKGDNFLIRLATSTVADRSKLSAEYFEDYNKIKALSEKQQALLMEKDDRIKDYKNMINTLINKPTLYAQNYYNQGDTMSDKSKNVNINNSGEITGIVLDNNTGVVGKDMTGVAGGNISGTVTVSIGELAQSNTPEAPKMADLLKQLQTAIESEANLSDKDKTKALKQIKVLAEAGTNPQDEEKKGLAETAVDILKAVLLIEIPSLAGTVQVFKELLPLIQAYFGL